jgi:LSD1 subclass zinc finger protein
MQSIPCPNCASNIAFEEGSSEVLCSSCDTRYSPQLTFSWKELKDGNLADSASLYLEELQNG